MAQLFPKWANQLPALMAVGGGLGSVGAVFVVWVFFSPTFTDVGYMPTQPVPYSHRLHVGELGLDCRYCHVGVEQGPHALLPAAETCMNCHSSTETDGAFAQFVNLNVEHADPEMQEQLNAERAAKLAPVLDSFKRDKPVAWVKVHDLPDYAFFDHSRHVNSGVSCESCHGRVDRMDVVRQTQPLSMSWCLSCHRQPEAHLRPLDKVTEMGWEAANPTELGEQLKVERRINPPEHCSGCHR